jgi:hypothetical protein
MVSDRQLESDIENLEQWINEGRKFPNNYRNIQMISEQSIKLINKLVRDRAAMQRRIQNLEKQRQKR